MAPEATTPLAPGLHIPFDNIYFGSPPAFFARVFPSPVAALCLIRVNRGLVEQLGIDPDALAGPEGVQVLAGNTVPAGADPIALAYAGHQFSNFSPQLGDGRAVLLGEVVARDSRRYDIQLKGSGPTPFSSRGDGRAGAARVPYRRGDGDVRHPHQPRAGRGDHRRPGFP